MHSCMHGGMAETGMVMTSEMYVHTYIIFHGQDMLHNEMHLRLQRSKVVLKLQACSVGISTCHYVANHAI